MLLSSFTFNLRGAAAPPWSLNLFSMNDVRLFFWTTSRMSNLLVTCFLFGDPYLPCSSPPLPLPLPRLWLCFFVASLRCAALRSTSLQRSFFARVTGSRWIGGPWGSSSTSSWWAACRSSETPPRSCSDRSSRVRRRKPSNAKNKPQNLPGFVFFFCFTSVFSSYFGVHDEFTLDRTFQKRTFECVKAMQIDGERFKPWAFLQQNTSFDV